MNPRDYPVTIQKIDDENGVTEYVAMSPAFGTSHTIFESSPERAIEAFYEHVPVLVEVFQDAGIPVPDPLFNADSFSGSTNLRMPKSIHARASLQAKSEGVSLNEFIVTTIAEKLGTKLQPREKKIKTPNRKSKIGNRKSKEWLPAKDSNLD